MARNKYAKDYRLIETVDEKGRIHTSYEYIGPEYRFCQSPREVRRELNLRAILCAVGWLSFVGAMFPNSQAMRTFYISLPYVFTALPLALVTGTVRALWKVSQPMEHRFADKLENRYPPAAMAWTVLPLLAMLAQCIRVCIGGDAGRADVLFTLCAALCAACGAICFLRRGRLTARKG